jgi:hypothetical protein
MTSSLREDFNRFIYGSLLGNELIDKMKKSISSITSLQLRGDASLAWFGQSQRNLSTVREGVHEIFV